MYSYKNIPGNKNYRISLSQDIRDECGVTIKPSIVDGKIHIEMFGEIRILDLSWLALIAHFEMLLPEPNFEKLLKISFQNTYLKLTKPISGKIAIFKKPLIVKFEGRIFRIVPNFCRYAVSSYGDVLELEHGVIINHATNLKRHNQISPYPSVYIYNPERTCYKYVFVHRLVALAWIANLDYEYRPVVNHKDGNKLNCRASNLEWVTFQENSIHAVNFGLRTDNFACKVRDCKTGIVREFASIAQASQFMGLKQVFRVKSFYDVKGRLLSDRYEIKLKDDKTPWFYENRTEKVKLGRYCIIVTDAQGSVEEFFDTRDFKEKYQLWNIAKVTEMLNAAKQHYPGYKFELHDYYHSEDIQSYNVDTKEIISTKTISEMSKVTGVAGHAIRLSLRRSETDIKDKYAFRYKTDKEWDINFQVRQKIQYGVIAYDPITQEKYEFGSIRHAAKVLKVDRSSIKNSLLNNIPLRNWQILKNDTVLV